MTRYAWSAYLVPIRSWRHWFHWAKWSLTLHGNDHGFCGTGILMLGPLTITRDATVEHHA